MSYKNCNNWNEWTKKTVEYLLNITSIPVMVDCTRIESNISTLTDSVFNWSDENGIQLLAHAANKKLLTKDNHEPMIVNKEVNVDSGTELIESAIGAIDDNDVLYNENEDNASMNQFSVQMTESWNVEEITTLQIHIEEPTCITNSDTTTDIDFEHIIADKFIGDTSIEYHSHLTN